MIQKRQYIDKDRSNEHQADHCTFRTEYKPSGSEDERGNELYGWFFAIAAQIDDSFPMLGTVDNLYQAYTSQLDVINFGPFDTEESALNAARAAWVDRVRAAEMMNAISDEISSNRNDWNSFMLGISLSELERRHSEGIY